MSNNDPSHGWAFREHMLDKYELEYWSLRIDREMEYFGTEGTVRKKDETYGNNEGYRKGRIYFLDLERNAGYLQDYEGIRLYSLMVGAMHYMYETYLSHLGLNFKCGDSKIQLGRYNTGEYYQPHQDGIPGRGGDIDRRVLSATLCLSTANRGGDFYFTNAFQMTDDFHKQINTPGTLTVFPSWAMHGVRKVEKGVRRSATLWLENQ